MGLDVAATNGLIKIPKEEIPHGVEPYNDEFYDWENNADWHIKYINREDGYFEEYWNHHLDPFKTGYYREDDADYHSFRVGSYSYYNNWRKILALAIGFDNIGDIWNLGPYDAEIPFIELLDFSDAEGNIGPVVSEKLYNDFEDRQEEVFEFVDNLMFGIGGSDNKLSMTQVRDFKSVYEDWKLAFEIGQDRGIVTLQ